MVSESIITVIAQQKQNYVASPLPLPSPLLPSLLPSLLPILCSLGLLSIQNSPSLRDFSGFDNLREVGTIVIAYLRNEATVLDGFNSLFEAGRIIITFNMVSSNCACLYVSHWLAGLGVSRLLGILIVTLFGCLSHKISYY